MNRKITEYKIITTISLEQLTKLVNSEIKDGWTPFGSMSQKNI